MQEYYTILAYQSRWAFSISIKGVDFMKGVDSDIGMVVRFCLVTGLPANESRFNCTLRRISPALADIMTEEYEVMPCTSSTLDGK